MIYILNTFLKQEKKVCRGVQEIKGCGKKRAGKICNRLGITKNGKIKHLLPKLVEKLTSFITENYQTGWEGDQRVKKNIQRLVQISSYRGFRHIEGLPTRGQRTHGNSKTARRLNRAQHR